MLITVFSINTKNLNTSASDFSLANLVSLNTANAEWPFDPWPWDIDWGLQEKQQSCAYYYPDRSFTSSVEIACKTIECVVPLDCDCTPIPCGQI